MNIKRNKEVILTSPTPTITPIIKVVGSYCNLRCKYCFHHTTDQSAPTIMDENLLEKFIKEYLDIFSGRVLFVWHGGEPLLAGLPYFKKIIKLEQKYRKESHDVRNSVQTNGTLITEKWANFFKEHNFEVGVSLDGDKQSHNLFRKNYGGGGSFDQVMKGIRTLREAGIEPGFIKVVTKDSLARVEEDFNFFANDLGLISLGLSPYLDLEDQDGPMASHCLSNEGLKKYLKAFIDMWLTQGNTNLMIREIDNFLSGIKHKFALTCSFNGTCTGFMCLEYNGKIYPCDRLTGRDDLLFGDITEEPLLDVLNGDARITYAKKVGKLPAKCESCKWKQACHNGCPQHRIGGVDGGYYYCDARKETFDYLESKVDKLCR